MNFKSYNRLNNIIGWLVFGIAAFTYLSTMEHTVSLWDCGEFTPSARRLEVPHPPGAPFYLIVYRMFTMLAGDNVKMVPIFTNSASALNSAFCILFLFWSITALALKMLVKDKTNMAKGDVYAIMAAGAVGGLAYTFSDTLWFSAVESEVYAMSSMLTALVFWLVLKWEARSDEPNNLKWMVLIFYMIGIVIGVHLLGLLVIPAIFLVYYFKKYKTVTWKGLGLALVLGVAALGTVQIIIIQVLPTIGAFFDRIFANGGAPFWSGVMFFYLLIFGGTGYLIWWTHKKKKVMFNTGLLCFISVIIGYSSYAICPIRSMADTAIDMNDTEDVYNFLGYLGRDQYGDNYLLSGPYYTAFTHNSYESPTIKVVNSGQLYRTDKKNHEYVEAGHKKSYEFPNAKYRTFFPRMASQGESYIQGYKYWGNVKNESSISFKNNMTYFFSYQINYMYFRYFAWNFIGRQNDMQGIINEFHQGNWITGIPFIDSGILHTGPTKGLPYYLASNKGRNKLFGLPFLLGILGMIFQYRKNRNDFFTILFFFFMTGLAIEIYLNMPSPQPRERDYAFVGSFYVFAFWIGFGVLWIYDLIRKRAASISAPTVAILSGVLCMIAVPTLMAAQEWDDHDRSKRTCSLDYGADYLESCAPHAVLFTNGDNDTYPLWYAQEVEGIRDDIRIVNLSLFGTDSYINQMRHPVNNAIGLPFTLTEDQTLGWEYVPYYAEYAKAYDQKNYTDYKKVLAFIASNASDTKLPPDPDEDNTRAPFMPTKKFKIVVDKAAAIASGTVPADKAAEIVDELDIDIHKSNMFKSDIMLLDFIATNNWKNPVYFSITSGPDEYLSLGKYLQQEGLAYRLVPVKNPLAGIKGQDDKRVATDIMYNNIMTKFKWGGLDKHDSYMDYVLARQSENIRGVFQKMANQLMAEGQKDKAVKIADKMQEVIPETSVPYTYYYNVIPMVRVYFDAGAKDKGKKLGMHMADRYIEELKYYAEASKNKKQEQDLYNFGRIQQATAAINMLVQIANEYKETELLNKVKPAADTYNALWPQQNQQGAPADDSGEGDPQAQ